MLTAHKGTMLAFLLTVGACGTAARATSSDEPLRFRREGDWLKFKVLVYPGPLLNPNPYTLTPNL